MVKVDFLLSFCIAALNPLSCQAFKNVQAVQQRASVNIDVDGSGPLKPFPVTCEFFCKSIITAFDLSLKY